MNLQCLKQFCLPTPNNQIKLQNNINRKEAIQKKKDSLPTLCGVLRFLSNSPSGLTRQISRTGRGCGGRGTGRIDLVLALPGTLFPFPLLFDPGREVQRHWETGRNPILNKINKHLPDPYYLQGPMSSMKGGAYNEEILGHISLNPKNTVFFFAECFHPLIFQVSY